jgi:hypothetical protein
MFERGRAVHGLQHCWQVLQSLRAHSTLGRPRGRYVWTSQLPLLCLHVLRRRPMQGE